MSIIYLLSKLIKKLHISAVKNSDINSTSRICSGSHVVDSTIGRYTYIGNFCTVVNASFGGFCSVADNCIIGGAQHPLCWVSTSPVFHKGKNVLNKNFSNHEFETSKKTFIGNDVWIGNNCLIKGGVSIGDGAVIGMGSVVTKDVKPYEIWAGNPAKLIRKRFSDKDIQELLNISWWKKTEQEISEYSQYANNLEEYLKEFGGENRI